MGKGLQPDTRAVSVGNHVVINILDLFFLYSFVYCAKDEAKGLPQVKASAPPPSYALDPLLESALP